MKDDSHRKLLFFVTEDWYFFSHRIPLAIAAKEAGYEVSVVTRVRKYGDVIREAGLKLIPFENSRSGVNPLNELVTLARLILLYRRERPDIVHHVAMKPVLYGSIAARVTRVPHVVNALAGMGWLFASDSGYARWFKPVTRWGLGRLLRSGIALVQNPDDAQLLINTGVPDLNVRQIAGAGVDLQCFHPQPEPDEVPKVVLPARLLWDKGVGEFVKAARMIKKQGIEARFLLAGEPDNANPSSIPMDQIARWVSAGLVEHLGWVKDMPRLLNNSHIVCLPSYREGLPKSLIEAAAAGRSIVSTDVPGCREIVQHGYNGFLVPPRDADTLAQSLVKLIKDPELRREMGMNGRILAERRFGIERIIQRTLAIYMETAA